MSNDTTTLNGALAELGETMATNITAKGVSASASDGLTTLAGKISQISQSGGGTPVVQFNNTNFGTHFAFTRPNSTYKDTFVVNVPSTVTDIDPYCFYFLRNLTGVNFPSGLKTIGNYAFNECRGLTSATLPNGVTTIGSNAFYYCNSLTSINLPNTITSIGTYAFEYCTSLTSVTIPTGLTSLPNGCFQYCSGLTSVTIPSNITSMGTYCFDGCTSMQTIHFDSATPPTASTNCFRNLPTTCVIEVPCDSLSLYTSASNYPSSSTYTYVPYGCNGLKFLQDSYTTSTGTCEVSLRLWDNNAPVSGGTITITGSDSSSYTCTTDSNGEATCTLTNVSGTVTYTATYSSYSATCTVTAQTYLIYDDCSSASGLSNYGDNVKFERNPSTTLTFNTDEYVLAGSSCCFGGREILAMHGVNNAKLRIKFKLNTTSNAAYNQFCIFCTDKVVNDNPPFEYGTRVRNDKLLQYFTISSESTIYTHSVAYSTDWFYLEAEKDGTSWTIRLYDSSLSLLKENTRTLSSMSNPNWYIALLSDKGTNYSVHIKEVLAEAL